MPSNAPSKRPATRRKLLRRPVSSRCWNCAGSVVTRLIRIRGASTGSSSTTASTGSERWTACALLALSTTTVCWVAGTTAMGAPLVAGGRGQGETPDTRLRSTRDTLPPQERSSPYPLPPAACRLTFPDPVADSLREAEGAVEG